SSMLYRRVAWPCQCCASAAPSLHPGSTAAPACNHSSWARARGILGPKQEGRHSRSGQAPYTAAGNASTESPSRLGQAFFRRAVVLPLLGWPFPALGWVGGGLGRCLPFELLSHPTGFGRGASKVYASCRIFIDWAACTDFPESAADPIRANEPAAGASSGLSRTEPRAERDFRAQRRAGREGGGSVRGAASGFVRREASGFTHVSFRRGAGAFRVEATEDRNPGQLGHRRRPRYRRARPYS